MVLTGRRSIPEARTELEWIMSLHRLKLYSEMDDVMSIYSEGKDMGTEIVICLKKKEEGEPYHVQDQCWLMMKGS